MTGVQKCALPLCRDRVDSRFLDVVTDKTDARRQYLFIDIELVFVFGLLSVRTTVTYITGPDSGSRLRSAECSWRIVGSVTSIGRLRSAVRR